MPEPPEWLIPIAIFAIVSSAAFVIFLKEDFGVWWSMLLAVVVGLAILALKVAYGYAVDLIERFRQKKPARLEKDGPSGTD